MSERLSYRLKILVAVTVLAGLSALIWTSAPPRVAAQSKTAQQATNAQDAKPFDQEQKLAELRKKIAGQEEKPAEQVFKNIQILKGMPAGRLLRIMEVGYSRSLGVNCTHCHVVDQWEKEDKPTKQVTRDMIMMMRAINEEYLKKIKNLKSETPVVNCTTCHRGQTKPALNLPEAGTK